MYLMKHLKADELCPECRTVKVPRSRHCNICGVCVDRFDHHCPWLNICIGRRNQMQFMIFLVVELFFLYAVAGIILVFYVEEFWRVQDRLDLLPYRSNPLSSEEVCGAWDWCFVIRNMSRYTTHVMAHVFAFIWLVGALIFSRPVHMLFTTQVKNYS